MPPAKKKNSPAIPPAKTAGGVKPYVAPKRSKVVQARMRFEIDIPDDLPKENGEQYAVERFKKLCEKLNSIRGVGVDFTLI